MNIYLYILVTDTMKNRTLQAKIDLMLRSLYHDIQQHELTLFSVSNL